MDAEMVEEKIAEEVAVEVAGVAVRVARAMVSAAASVRAEIGRRGAVRRKRGRRVEVVFWNAKDRAAYEAAKEAEARAEDALEAAEAEEVRARRALRDAAMGIGEIRAAIMANDRAGRGSYEGLSTEQVSLWHRALMFGNQPAPASYEEAYEWDREWSSWVD